MKKFATIMGVLCFVTALLIPDAVASNGAMSNDEDGILLAVYQKMAQDRAKATTTDDANSQNSAPLAASQTYNRGYYLYIKVGESTSKPSEIKYVHFNAEGKMYFGSMSQRELTRLYNESLLDEYAVNKGYDKQRNSKISTNKYDVYSSRDGYSDWSIVSIPNGYAWGTGTPQYRYESRLTFTHTGDNYYAISIDKQELITWYQAKDSNNIQQKTYYKRVNVEDVIEKPTDYDFLY